MYIIRFSKNVLHLRAQYVGVNSLFPGKKVDIAIQRKETNLFLRKERPTGQLGGGRGRGGEAGS